MLLLMGLAITAGLGCETAARTHNYSAIAGVDLDNPPEDAAKLSIHGDVRLVSINGEIIDGVPMESTPGGPPAMVEAERNPRWNVLIPPGKHTLEVGIASRWVYLSTETPLLVILFTGGGQQTAGFYPGSTENQRITFTATPGRRYRLTPDWTGEDWTIKVETGSEVSRTEVGEVVARVPHEDPAGRPGTNLSHRTWIKRQRDTQKQFRSSVANSPLTKPRAN